MKLGTHYLGFLVVLLFLTVPVPTVQAIDATEHYNPGDVNVYLVNYNRTSENMGTISQNETQYEIFENVTSTGLIKSVSLYVPDNNTTDNTNQTFLTYFNSTTGNVYLDQNGTQLIDVLGNQAVTTFFKADIDKFEIGYSNITGTVNGSVTGEGFYEGTGEPIEYWEVKEKLETEERYVNSTLWFSKDVGTLLRAQGELRLNYTYTVTGKRHNDSVELTAESRLINQSTIEELGLVYDDPVNFGTPVTTTKLLTSTSTVPTEDESNSTQADLDTLEGQLDIPPYVYSLGLIVIAVRRKLKSGVSRT